MLSRQILHESKFLLVNLVKKIAKIHVIYVDRFLESLKTFLDIEEKYQSEVAHWYLCSRGWKMVALVHL